mmetsp:Transcript_41442/g.133694  ORF Transcript_41442/g.133694 Transcript_41442/m.133694 type:complete len:293 (+) Transcript_41442:831-1709(+)
MAPSDIIPVPSACAGAAGAGPAPARPSGTAGGSLPSAGPVPAPAAAGTVPAATASAIATAEPSAAAAAPPQPGGIARCGARDWAGGGIAPPVLLRSLARLARRVFASRHDAKSSSSSCPYGGRRSGVMLGMGSRKCWAEADIGGGTPPVPGQKPPEAIPAKPGIGMAPSEVGGAPLPSRMRLSGSGPAVSCCGSSGSVPHLPSGLRKPPKRPSGIAPSVIRPGGGDLLLGGRCTGAGAGPAPTQEPAGAAAADEWAWGDLLLVAAAAAEADANRAASTAACSCSLALESALP